MPKTTAEPTRIRNQTPRQLVIFMPLTIISLYCLGMIASSAPSTTQTQTMPSHNAETTGSSALGNVVQPVRPILSGDTQFQAGPPTSAISPENNIDSAAPSPASTLQNSPSVEPSELNQTLQAPFDTSSVNVLAL